MTDLSPREIAEYAHGAGFRGDSLATAVAVALAESGGLNDAHNDTAPDNSYGLWQINMLGAMGPERRAQFGIDHNAALFRPAENAKAAYEISGNGKDWTPWSTYTSGAYRDYLDEARRATRTMGDGRDGKNGRHGPRGGFQVNLAELGTFVRQTRGMAEDLRTTATRTMGAIDAAAGRKGFGAIGAETGFVKALADFGHELRRQTRGMAHNASTFADGTHEVAKVYRDLESRGKAALRDATDKRG